MLRNLLLNSILLIFLSINSCAQEVRISKTIPELSNAIVGTWGSKIISRAGEELWIVDTASLNPDKQVLKMESRFEKAKFFWAIHYFVQDHFLFEVYAAYEKAPFKKYNLILKRDLETMQVVGHKQLEHFYSHVKFSKSFKNDFYICFGNSYPYVDLAGAYAVYNYPLSADKIAPTKLYSMNYDLSESWSMDFQELAKRHDFFMNDITFDEEYLLIPQSFIEPSSAGNEKDIKRGLNLTIADPKGKLAAFQLDLVDLDIDFNVHSAKLRYDENAQKISGILLVSRRNSGQNDLAGYYEYGYVHAEWNEKGEMIDSKLRLMGNDEIFASYFENSESSKNGVFIRNLSNPLGMKAEILFFEFLDNGDALYVVNNVCKRGFEELEHAKFILCISKEGAIKWSKLIPYSSNRLYQQVLCIVRNGKIHFITREFLMNYSTGSYIYYDSKQIASEESVVVTDRVIDLETGEIISHKPILDTPMGKFEFSGSTYQYDADQWIIRYRNTRANLEKLMILKF